MQIIKAGTAQIKLITKDTRGTPRLYYWPKQESILDNVMNRRNRPVAEWKADAMATLEAAGFGGEYSLQWSQNAGCSCGCSPGFIIRGTLIDHDNRPVKHRDVHIDASPSKLVEVA